MRICIDLFVFFTQKNKVFLRVKPKRSSLKMKSEGNYPLDTVVLLEVLGWIGNLSYKLALIPNACTWCLSCQLLRKYVPNIGHILDLDDNGLVNQEEFRMELGQILKTERNSCITVFFKNVLVQRKDYLGEMIPGKTGTKLIARIAYLQH